jgi:molybdate transport system substrate-binding protein
MYSHDHVPILRFRFVKTFHKTMALAACFTAIVTNVPARSDEILVSAAASLTDAFTDIGKAYSAAHPGTVVRFNFGASGALQQQIVQGAPVDVYASASPQEMDALQKANRIEPGTRIDFAGNRLVLIVPPGSLVKRWNDLRSGAVRRIAISNPDSVPSGRYAKETLTKRGLWTAVEPKMILGENVRQTLTYVAGGNVDAGIVFATDAQIEKRRVNVVDEAATGKDHSAIVYPASAIAHAPNAAGARRFTSFLIAPAAQAILKRYGFARTARSSASNTGLPGPHKRPAVHSNASRR